MFCNSNTHVDIGRFTNNNAKNCDVDFCDLCESFRYNSLQFSCFSCKSLFYADTGFVNSTYAISDS